ncbi:metalloprotease [Streptomyces sp. NPDC054847]
MSIRPRHLFRTQVPPDEPVGTRRARHAKKKSLGAVAVAVGAALVAVSFATNQDADAASPRTCLNGTLAFHHLDAEAGTSKPDATQVARNANWELWGATRKGSAARKLAGGITNASNGSFSACYSGAASLSNAHVRFNSASNSMWRVVKKWDDTTRYTFNSRSLANISGDKDLGTVMVPSSMERAWKIVDTLNLLYWKRGTSSACWTGNRSEDSCPTLTFAWGQNNEEGGYWDHPSNSDDTSNGTDFVLLSGDMPDSKHTILHEAGHWLQYQLYGDWWPEVTGCNPHFVEKKSSDTCAWTEGFADAVAAYALNDYRYVSEDGGSVSFLNDSTTPGWAEGDEVQGRVSSSLLDLWADADGGTWNDTIAAMTKTVNRSSDFYDYFTRVRKNASLSTTGTAEDIIRRHTIKY